MVMMIIKVAKMIITDDHNDHGDQDGYPHFQDNRHCSHDDS